jgi:hypothetical protein
MDLEDGRLVDPELDLGKTKSTQVCGFLGIEHEIFILGLHAENPARSNQDYCNNLLEGFRISLSPPSSISDFFLKRLDHTDNFRKAVLVPADKFQIGNKAPYLEFMAR